VAAAFEIRRENAHRGVSRDPNVELLDPFVLTRGKEHGRAERAEGEQPASDKMLVH
jgi:hypothetical protein